MKHLVLQALGSLADWFVAALALAGIGGGGILGVGAKVNRRTKDNEDRSKRNKRILEGDPDNPQHDGLLSTTQETRQRVEDVEHKIDELGRKMDEQHSDLLDRLDERDGGD